MRIFADVRRGEGGSVLLLALNIFIILSAYYVLKPVREALILQGGSAELKSYLSAGQVVLLAFILPLYARLVSGVSRRRLINIVTAFFVVCLVLFYVLGTRGVRLDIPFFLWIGIFNMMIVAQFWGFANDIYSKQEGERLFPIVGFGASVGAVVGARLAAELIAPFGIFQLMLLGAGLLVLQAAVTNLVDRRVGGRSESSPVPAVPVDRGKATPPASRSGAFAMVFRSPYLLSIGAAMLLLNLVNTTGEFILGTAISQAAETAVAAGESGGLSVQQVIGQAYAQYFSLTNILGLILQLFLVSRMVRYFGVPACFAILPVISFISYNTLAFIPVISVMVAAKVAENSVDYSLNNTVRNMLFLPTTREEKYSAKQVIDAFLVRSGDVLSAVLVFVGVNYVELSASGFAVANAGLALVWLVLAIRVGRMYREKTRGPADEPPGFPTSPRKVALAQDPS